MGTSDGQIALSEIQSDIPRKRLAWIISNKSLSFCLLASPPRHTSVDFDAEFSHSTPSDTEPITVRILRCQKNTVAALCSLVVRCETTEFAVTLTNSTPLRCLSVIVHMSTTNYFSISQWGRSNSSSSRCRALVLLWDAKTYHASWDSTPVDEAERVLLSELAPGISYIKRAVPVRPPSSAALDARYAQSQPSTFKLNTVSVGPQDAPALVVLHGWGAGVGLFGRNFLGLSKAHRVHFIDWLGFGASSRPPYNVHASPEEAECFFLDVLEDWVEQMRHLESRFEQSIPFHLCGHSMGAFLAVSFALRHPQLVSNLILVSPVGVPRVPANKFPPPSAPLMKRILFRIIFALWERHWTPQYISRYAPAFVGRAFAAWLIDARFPARTIAARNALVEYAYQNCIAPPSGEHSLSTILESGAYARRPLIDKLPNIRVPVLFMYGERDWMDHTAAEKAMQNMICPTDLVQVSASGHHLYYDNPDEFAKAVIEACAAVRSSEEQESMSSRVLT